MGEVKAIMATVPSRTGDGRPVRPPVAMPASGFGGSGPHCGHTPSCRRYVGTALVVVVSAGFLESVLLEAGSLESATPWLSWGGRSLEAGPPSMSRLQR